MQRVFGEIGYQDVELAGAFQQRVNGGIGEQRVGILDHRRPFGHKGVGDGPAHILVHASNQHTLVFVTAGHG